jgi:hypothetical protein
MWTEIADMRFAERIGTEAEALRRIIDEALKNRRKDKP